MRKNLVLSGLIILLAVALMAGCAGMKAKPSEANFKTPKVTLSHVEVPYYTGYWYFNNKVEPTKGKAGAYGAPIIFAFIYEIENPNEYPVELDGFSFAVHFEDFEVNTVMSPETMWIPAGKVNQLRVPAVFDTQQTLNTLMLPGAMKLKEKGITAWDALEKWWTGAPDFSFPVSAKEGSAIFKAGDLTKVAAFEATFP
jgi:Late embryogenesis abundant protein